MRSRAFSRTFGKGPRPALAIHCTLGHSGAWQGVGAALGSRLTLTACDLPGHGRSPAWDGRSDFHQACTNMARPFLVKDTDLIGHSFGATIALRLAVENPGMIRSLTLIEPVFFAVLKKDHPEHLAAYAMLNAPFARALEDGDLEQAARRFNRLWGDGTSWAEIPAATRRYMTDRIHLVPTQSPMIFDDNAGLLRSGVFERLNMPVLLMRGAESLQVTGQIGAALARRLPDARVAHIPGAGHMAPVTHSVPVATEIGLLLDMAQKDVNLGG